MHILGAVLTWASVVLLFSPLAMAAPSPQNKAPPYPAPDPKGPLGGTFCGKFTTGNINEGYRLANSLAERVNDHLSDDCTTPARTCRRHACKDTTAIYVCNDNHYDIELSCVRHVGNIARDLRWECCIPHNDWYGQYHGFSAQQFVDQLGYNVIIAYGNCNHGIDADFPGMGPPSDPWGPNGMCPK